MEEELDLTEVLSAVERVRRSYRKPLPGFKTRAKTSGKSRMRAEQPTGRIAEGWRFAQMTSKALIQCETRGDLARFAA